MFYEQLKQACKHNNTSVTAVLKHIGLGSANGTYWKNGSIPASDIVVKLAEFLNTSTDYLLLGKEHVSNSINLSNNEQVFLEHYKKLSEKEQVRLLGRVEVLAELAEEERKKSKPAPKTKKSKPADDEPPKTITMRKFKDAASAGKGIELGDGDYEEITVLDTTLTEKADIAIRVSGDSMEPDYCDGETVLVRLTPYVEFNEIGIFRADNCGYIKKKGCDRLISINREREDILFSDHSEVVAIGRVIGKLNPDWITD